MNKENSSSKKLKKELDEFKEKYEELLKAHELKDELIIMLVHDFKSPLSSLMENLKVVHKEIGSTFKQLSASKKHPPSSKSSLEKQLYHLSSANTDAQLLWRRVANLLDIKKIEENKMHLELAEFDMNNLIDEAVSDQEMMASCHRVKIAVSNLIKNSLVYTDYDLILRVLTNLLSNGIKHSDREMEGKGEVTLTAKEEGDFLKFEVLDSGQGIPEGFQKILFEKFTQLKRLKGSTGLGLTFSKLAVESLQGKINSKNIKNQGALFYFSIPKRFKQGKEEEKVDLEQWKFTE